MRASTAARYAVLLILLVLGQEFHCARILKNQALKDRRIEKREIQEEEHALEAKSRQKRVAPGVVLLAVTFTTSVLTIGFEIYNTIEGCCGMYPSACTYAKEIEKYEKIWPNKTKVSDDLLLKAINLMEDVIQHNNEVNEILVNLDSISNTLDKITVLLSPTSPNKFQEKWLEIEGELNKGNTTVGAWSYDEINVQFTSVFDSPQHALYGMSNFLGQSLGVMYAIAKHNYLKNYQAKHIKRLTTGPSMHQLLNAQNTKAAKLIGLDNLEIKDFARKITNQRIEAKYGGGKYRHILNAYTIISAAWALGNDAFRIYHSVQQCKDKRDAVKDIYDNWKNADDELTTVVAYTHTYIANLTEGWNYVKSNLTDANLLKSLEQAKEISQAVSPQTPRLTEATQYINNYITNIKTTLETSPDQAYDMESKLVEGLMTVKLCTQCCHNRLEMINYVSVQCKAGADDLNELYLNAKSLFTMSDTGCTEVGIEEITLANMESIIDARSSVEDYNKDCILNSESKKNAACRLMYDGYHAQDIATVLSLTDSQARHLIANCPAPPLTANEERIVCRLRLYGDSDEDILLLFPGNSIDNIKAVTCS